jgi:hypothetical protein
MARSYGRQSRAWPAPTGEMSRAWPAYGGDVAGMARSCGVGIRAWMFVMVGARHARDRRIDAGTVAGLHLCALQQ